MRVLALSPGSLNQQLHRLPALAAAADQLQAKLQVVCDPAQKAAWDLLPAIENVIPFTFNSTPSLADWNNLLGHVREQDFQICLNFAKGQPLNLMLLMSHIPIRIAEKGFANTAIAIRGKGWSAQQLGCYLHPIGLSLDADVFRLSIPKTSLQKVRDLQPTGEGPLLLLAPNGTNEDWPNQQWSTLPNTIRNQLPNLRSVSLPLDTPLIRRVAEVACADVVLSSCPITQLLAVYTGVSLVALGTPADALPKRNNIHCLIPNSAELNALSQQEVLSALGF
ncbi:MAG: glycosyltransferase family 9 protein [Prochlorococcus sp.]